MDNPTFTKQEIEHLYLLHYGAFAASKIMHDVFEEYMAKLADASCPKHVPLTHEQLDQLGQKMHDLLEGWK